MGVPAGPVSTGREIVTEGVCSAGTEAEDEMRTELDPIGRRVGREEGCGREDMVTRVREDEVEMLELETGFAE